jgi:hypothetical protein
MDGAAPAPGPQGTTADGLRILLLGPPDVVGAGQRPALPRRQARALLYRLAAADGAVARGHLAFLFWPDLPEAAARRNLTHLLTHLRRALPVAGLVLPGEGAIGLDPARVWCDMAAFTRLTATPAPSARTGSWRPWAAMACWDRSSAKESAAIDGGLLLHVSHVRLGLRTVTGSAIPASGLTLRCCSISCASLIAR